MEITEIKQELLQIIQNANDQELKALYIKLLEDTSAYTNISEEKISEVRERKAQYLRGEIKLYDWDSIKSKYIKE